MSQPDKVSEILESLHEHVDEQKRLLDEENEKLLAKGKINFEKALANEQLAFSLRRNKSPNVSLKQTLKTITYSIGRTVGNMRPGKLLDRARRAQPKRIAGEVVHGHSSIVGAMGWMFCVSFLLTLLLGWVPFVGPFIGPIIGGYLGGRRAGSVSRALLAAFLPALLLSLFIIGLGMLAASFADRPVIGAIAVFIAGALSVILIIHNLLLFVAAFAGGLLRKLEGS